MSAVARVASAALAGVALAACAGLAVSQPSAPVPGLTCLLHVPQTVAVDENAVPLGFTLRNDGAVPVLVLKRQTPLEGFLGDLFVVTRAGHRLDYHGPVVKRGPPGPDEFVELAPGAHAHATVDLLEAYDVAAPGRYAVRFQGTADYACNEVAFERD